MNLQKTVIIVGSSCKNGNTTKIVDAVASQSNIEVINLSDYDFSYYDYENKNINDDFLSLMKEII